jgi:hypothetical protein
VWQKTQQEEYRARANSEIDLKIAKQSCKHRNNVRQKPPFSQAGCLLPCSYFAQHGRCQQCIAEVGACAFFLPSFDPCRQGYHWGGLPEVSAQLRGKTKIAMYVFGEGWFLPTMFMTSITSAQLHSTHDILYSFIALKHLRNADLHCEIFELHARLRCC